MDSSPSPYRLDVWSSVDQGAISGKVSPSSAFPSSPGTQPLVPLPASGHRPSRSCPCPESPLPFSRKYISFSTILHKLPFPEPHFCSATPSAPSAPLPRHLLLRPPNSSCPSPGQILSATQEQIAESYYPEYLINLVQGQLQTRQASSIYDDSYLGERAAGEGTTGETSGTAAPTPPTSLLPLRHPQSLLHTCMQATYEGPVGVGKELGDGPQQRGPHLHPLIMSPRILCGCGRIQW